MRGVHTWTKSIQNDIIAFDLYTECILGRLQQLPCIMGIKQLIAEDS